MSGNALNGSPEKEVSEPPLGGVLSIVGVALMLSVPPWALLIFFASSPREPASGALQNEVAQIGGLAHFFNTVFWSGVLVLGPLLVIFTMIAVWQILGAKLERGSALRARRKYRAFVGDGDELEIDECVPVDAEE